MSWSDSHLPFLLPLSAVLLSACGGGFGDPPSPPLADEYGDGARLHEIVGPATWVDPADTDSANCKHPADQGVYVTGATIVAIDKFDETGDGAFGNYYVEDAAHAYGAADEPDDEPVFPGVTVFEPSFSPPDLRLAQGDVVDIIGVFMEFLGPAAGKFGQCRTLPEIGGTLIFRFDGSREIVPKTVEVSALKSYETARPLLGRLVRIVGIGGGDVALASAGANSGGRYTAQLAVGGGIEQADVPRVANELYDIEKEGPPLAENGTFKSITGVVTYFYGFKIVPRSPADFEP
jgi:hypothetical protein